MSSEDSVRPSYADEHIEVLSPIESIRRRPAMYIGGVDQRGIEQMCRSLLSVFFSQHLAGNVSKLRLSLSPNTVELWCYGLELSFDEVIHSFEEYQIDQRHWKGIWNWYPGGFLGGCDFVVCNALSSSLESQCISGGVITQRAYRQGVRCEDGHEQKKMIDEGLWLRFRLDEEIFGEATLVVDDLKCWLNEQLRLLPTLTIDFEDRDSGIFEELTEAEGMH